MSTVSRDAAPAESASYWDSSPNPLEAVGSTLWSLVLGVLPLAMILVGAFFLQVARHAAIGVVLVVGGAFWIGGRALVDYSLGRPLETFAAQRCNAVLVARIFLREVLGSRPMKRVFERLQELGAIEPQVSFPTWSAALVDEFRRGRGLAPEAEAVETVTFDLTGGQLKVNDVPRRLPILEHELSIPWSLGGVAAVEQREQLDPKLKIRLAVLNGVLRLQVGEWTRTLGPAGASATEDYRAWDTLASFPLLLDPLDHFLPPQYLLLDFFVEAGDVPHRSARKRQFLNRVEDYRRILNTWGGYGEGLRWKRMKRHFHDWLERDGFEQDRTSTLDSAWTHPYMSLQIHCDQDRLEMHEQLRDTRSPRV